MKLRVALVLALLAVAVVVNASAQSRPNLTAKLGMKIGRTFVKWGDTVLLKSRDILSQGKRVSTLQISYEYVNTTKHATPRVFSNRVTSDGILVGEQTDLAMGSDDTQTATFRGTVTIGRHKIVLMIDVNNDVTEQNEQDNRFVVFVIVP